MIFILFTDEIVYNSTRCIELNHRSTGTLRYNLICSIYYFFVIRGVVYVCVCSEFSLFVGRHAKRTVVLHKFRCVVLRSDFI